MNALVASHGRAYLIVNLILILKVILGCMLGTLIRQDEVIISKFDIVDAYKLSLTWLNKKNYTIIEDIEPFFIKAEQRIPSMGEDVGVDSWLKDLEISISKHESDVKLITTFYSPYSLSNNVKEKASLIFKGHILELYQYLGIEKNNEFYKKIHNQEYLNYKIKKANYLTIYIIIMNLIILYELLNLIFNTSYLIIILLADVILVYKIIVYSREKIIKKT